MLHCFQPVRVWQLAWFGLISYCLLDGDDLWGVLVFHAVCWSFYCQLVGGDFALWWGMHDTWPPSVTWCWAWCGDPHLHVGWCIFVVPGWGAICTHFWSFLLCEFNHAMPYLGGPCSYAGGKVGASICRIFFLFFYTDGVWVYYVNVLDCTIAYQHAKVTHVPWWCGVMVVVAPIGGCIECFGAPWTHALA